MPKQSLALILAALALLCTGAWAGDTSSFVDLGFSPDGKYYMFGQFGVEAKVLKPWAEIFVVDVHGNRFVADGRKAFSSETPVVAGQDGSGAFYKLLSENGALASRSHVDFLRQGSPLFISVDEGLPVADGKARVEFRNFEAGESYVATLVPYVEASSDSSSFFITVERTLKDGSKKNYTVGTPGLKRPGVVSYRIRRAVIAPRDGSLVFVVELWKKASSGSDVRYMVEALSL